MSDIELDVRHLPPPEPFERALLALRRLAQGSTLVLHIHRDPLPLYSELAHRGFEWETEALAVDHFRIRITHAASDPP